MRLFAAILPPSAVVEQIAAVVRSVNPPEAQDESPRAGRVRRLVRRPARAGGGAHAAGRAPAPPAPEPMERTHELVAVPATLMYLPVAGFGNVTLGDSIKLAAALRAEVATWSRPELVIAGGTALEFTGDQSVWAKIEGDVDGLTAIGRGVPQAVQRVGYFVDRRQFRPWLSVGTITPTTTAPYLERLVGALDSFRSEPWAPAGVSLMKWVSDDGSDQHFELVELMPLG